MNYNIDIDETIFSFDTSVLLELFSYSNNALDDFEKLFEKLGGKLFIPHHAYYEFNNKKNTKINDPIKTYEVLEKAFEAIVNKFTDIKSKAKSENIHPVIDNIIFKDFNTAIDKFQTDFKNEISKTKEDLKSNNSLNKIDKLLIDFFGIGPKMSYINKKEIVIEGKIRYEHEIPPGYADNKHKVGFAKYGDLFIWKELINFHKTENKKCVFVTNDLKEDWWNQSSIKKPRMELVEEFEELTLCSFGMLTFKDFIDYIKKEVKINLNENTYKEVNKLNYKLAPKSYQDIYLSASYEENEYHRLYRLESVAKFIKKHHQNIPITDLHDHKGELTVTWREIPNEFEKELINNAWELQNELKDNIIHDINTNLI